MKTFYKILILIFIFSGIYVLSSTFSTVHAESADLKCLDYRYNIGLKEAICDNVAGTCSTPALPDEVNCNGQLDSNKGWSYVDAKKCVDASITINLKTDICIQNTSTIPAGLVKVTIIDPGKCATTCNADEDCRLINPLVAYSYAPGGPAQTHVWMCVRKEDVGGSLHIKMFGVDMGPPHVAIPKLLRTGFTIGLVFFGVYSMYQLFTAIWESATGRKAESYETAQKRVLSALIGVFWVIVGIILVQALASLFGVSGNIFDFNYVP
jgi:hypothetical protein